MVELMSRAMEENFDGDNGSWEQDADKLLALMEEKGIRPPENGVSYDSGWDAGGEYFCTSTPTFEWDKE